MNMRRDKLILNFIFVQACFCRNLLSIDSPLNQIDPSTNISPPNPEQVYRTKFEILLEEVLPNSIELSNFKCDITLVPTGASGDLLPNRYAYEYNSGFTLELRSRFKVICICGSNRYHSLTGKFGSAPAILASK